MRQIAVDRVVRRGLVGDDIRAHAALDQFGEHIRRVAEQADGFRLARLGPAVDHREGFVEGVGLFIKVFRAQAEVDAVRVALHREAARTGENSGERLRAAHAAEARR